MDRLLAVNTKELRFNFEVGKKAVATVTLVNLMHTMPVAFKVSSTSPSQFGVRPHIAVILPQGMACVEVTMLAQKNLPATFPNSPDKLYIMSLLLPTRKCTVKELQKKFAFKRTPVFLDATLNIVFTGSLILRCLVTSDSLESLNEVIPDADVNAVDAQDRSALYLATLQGNPLMVKLLAEAGADVNMKSKMGETPLLEAACGGYVEIVKILLDSGANREVRNPRGRTPLQAAAAWNHLDVLTVLLGARADKEASDDEGKTALHHAVEAGHVSAVELLVECGADKDIKCHRGWTALHWAAGNGRLDVAELLLQRGANMDTRDGKGRTPSTLALEQGHHDMLDALRLRSILQKAAKEGDTGTLKECLLLGASVERKDQNGWTALHVAAFKGEMEAVKLLLKHGAKVNEADDEGYTALHCAVETGHKEVVALLLQKGAELRKASSCVMKIKRIGGVTPLELAVAMEHLPIAQLLEKRRISEFLHPASKTSAPPQPPPPDKRRVPLLHPYASFPSNTSSGPTKLTEWLAQSQRPRRHRIDSAVWL